MSNLHFFAANPSGVRNLPKIAVMAGRFIYRPTDYPIQLCYLASYDTRTYTLCEHAWARPSTNLFAADYLFKTWPDIRISVKMVPEIAEILDNNKTKQHKIKQKSSG
jgi:hypothetical protein